jgi:hypothetical protein
MKRFAARLLGAAIFTAALVIATAPAPALAVGQTPAGMHIRSPLRYVNLVYNFSTTANITAQVLGVCPPGGGVVKDVVLGQAAAGVGGTSWTATPKKNGTALVSTPGGFTLAAGANKATNVANTPAAFTNPSGGTRPILDAAQVKCAGGELVTTDITLSGTYSTAVTGSVVVRIEPNF